MKPFFLRVTSIVALVLALGPAVARADSDAEVAAHQSVLDLAGAFTNDGFKLRDGDYAGTLKAGQAAIVQVNLYAGNQYWFSAATSDPKIMISINLYDETGKLLKTDPYANGNRTATSFAPETSGPYYVRIAAAGAAATYCLVYSYK